MESLEKCKFTNELNLITRPVNVNALHMWLNKIFCVGSSNFQYSQSMELIAPYQLSIHEQIIQNILF